MTRWWLILSIGWLFSCGGPSIDLGFSRWTDRDRPEDPPPPEEPAEPTNPGGIPGTPPTPTPKGPQPDDPIQPIPDQSPTCDSLRAEGLICRESWCWLLDGRQGNTIYGGWTAAPDAIWAVGGAGTILFHDGSRWILEETGVVENLRAIHGLTRDEPWAVGENGTVLRRTNGTWTRVPGPGPFDLRKVRQTAADEVWAVGPEGAFHWKDGRWHQRSGTPLRSIWSRGRNEVWVAGRGVWRWDGEELHFVHDGDFVAGLDGQGPIISDSGKIHRWNGRAFIPWFHGHSDRSKLIDIAGPSLGDMWLLVGHPDERESGPYIFSLNHWDGSKQSALWEQWDRYDSRREGWPKYHALLHVEGDRLLMLGEDGGVFTHTSEGTEPRPRKHPHYNSLSVLGLNGIWTVHMTHPDTYETRRWDGSTGLYTEDFPGWLYRATAVSGTSLQDLWALLPGGIFSLHDATPALPGRFQAFSNLRDDELWAVGHEGHAARWKSGSWENLATGTEAAFLAAWLTASDDVWLGGDTLLHWDGQDFHVPEGIDPEAKLKIVSLAGSAPDDVWALGSPWTPGPELRHWDGKTWTSIEIPEASWCTSIWVSEDRDVFLSCSGGFYRHTLVGWRKLPVERPPSQIGGPRGLGIATVGNALLRYCRE